MGPLIGIVGRRVENAGTVRGEAVAAGWRYMNAINASGGISVVLPPIQVSRSRLEKIVSSLDGILLQGGIDISPSFYGQLRHHEVTTFDESLDLYEMALLRVAIHQNKPVLAICRGMQLLNVLEGGTLVQHIPEHRPSFVEHWLSTHEIIINTDSHLYKILGTSRLKHVASMHHQAVDTLGRNLRVVARSEDGLVEALEHTRAGWVLGVQWHPEDQGESFASRQLFSAFLRYCSENRANS